MVCHGFTGEYGSIFLLLSAFLAGGYAGPAGLRADRACRWPRRQRILTRRGAYESKIVFLGSSLFSEFASNQVGKLLPRWQDAAGFNAGRTGHRGRLRVGALKVPRRGGVNREALS